MKQAQLTPQQQAAAKIMDALVALKVPMVRRKVVQWHDGRIKISAKEMLGEVQIAKREVARARTLLRKETVSDAELAIKPLKTAVEQFDEDSRLLIKPLTKADVMSLKSCCEVAFNAFQEAERALS